MRVWRSRAAGRTPSCASGRRRSRPACEIEPGTRVLLHSPNTPEAVAAWLGILLAGGIVVATMPLLRAREIAKVTTKARVSACHRPGRAHGRDRRPRHPGDGGAAHTRVVRARRHGGRRCRDHRLHLRHHRGAEGHDALPPRPARVLRHVRRAGPQAPAHGRLQRHAAARLHLRARGGGALPAALRRLHGAHRARRPAADAARQARDHALHGAHGLPQPARRGGARVTAHVRQRGGAAARRRL